MVRLGQLIPNAMTRAAGRFCQCRVTAGERLGGGAEGSISSDAIGWDGAGSQRGVGQAAVTQRGKSMRFTLSTKFASPIFVVAQAMAMPMVRMTNPSDPFVRRRHA
jgi:hypothetical protein